MELIVQPAELATFLNAPSLATGDQTPLLLEVLEAAHEHVESVVGPLGGASRTYKVYASDRSRSLVLPATHLESITSITDPYGNEVTVNQATDVNFLAGIIELPRAMRGTWTVAATGRETRSSFKQAVKIIAGHLWESQRGKAGARESLYAGGADAAPRGFAIPHRAAQLLEPYAKLPGIA